MIHHRRRLWIAHLSLALATALLFTATGLVGARLQRALAAATLGVATPSFAPPHGEPLSAPCGAPLDTTRFTRRS